MMHISSIKIRIQIVAFTYNLFLVEYVAHNEPRYTRVGNQRKKTLVVESISISW